MSGKLDGVNKQPSEKPTSTHNHLDVQEVFYTIQGEGPHTGTPAVFLRLAGCNLQCPQCDTDYTSRRRLITFEEILFKIENCYKTIATGNKPKLIVISGGEPFRQKDSLWDFLYYMSSVHPVKDGLCIQIETNGTIKALSDHESLILAISKKYTFDFEIVCSPKTASIHSFYVAHTTYWKYVMDADHVCPVDGLPTNVLGLNVRPYRSHYPSNYHDKIYLQPVDASDPEQNERNLQACVISCMRYGYHLCIQTHKLAKLP